MQLRDDDIKKEIKEALGKKIIIIKGVDSDSDLSLDREDDDIAKQL